MAKGLLVAAAALIAAAILIFVPVWMDGPPVSTVGSSIDTTTSTTTSQTSTTTRPPTTTRPATTTTSRPYSTSITPPPPVTHSPTTQAPQTVYVTPSSTPTQTPATQSPAPSSVSVQYPSTPIQVPYLGDVSCDDAFAGIELYSGQQTSVNGTTMELMAGSDSRRLLAFGGTVPPSFAVRDMVVHLDTSNGPACYKGGLNNSQIGYDDWGQAIHFVISPEMDRPDLSGVTLKKIIVGMG